MKAGVSCEKLKTMMGDPLRDEFDPRMKNMRSQKEMNGFALLELLVTVAIIALLASLIAAGLSQSRSRARMVACENNFRQLIVAWNLYAGDNQERLVSNVHLDLTSGWVRGSVRGLGSTNIQSLVEQKHALFAPYIATPETYRCPADESFELIDNGEHPRVRSVSMNQAMGYESFAIWLPSKELARPGQQHFKIYRLSTDVDDPTERFVFIGESEITINDPAFAVEMPQEKQVARWIDVPTARHGGSGVLAFADGHIEARKWRDSRTASDHFNKSSEGNKDWLWLTERTSTR